MNSIILARGSGTRLYSLTKVTSRQLLSIYDTSPYGEHLKVVAEGR